MAAEVAGEKPESEPEIYTVLVNHEGQYSLWLKRNAVPRGWQAVGKQGEKADCLEYVRTVWTDMTPLSIRRKN
ncbi:MAG: MbtH family NRPS accessory protein [Alphaproteobacteria bacterium]|nr:MbtH family NRPS accessory protein [Alphaproteobacteria bacterium]